MEMIFGLAGGHGTARRAKKTPHFHRSMSRSGCFGLERHRGTQISSVASVNFYAATRTVIAIFSLGV